MSRFGAQSFNESVVGAQLNEVGGARRRGGGAGSRKLNGGYSQLGIIFLVFEGAFDLFTNHFLCHFRRLKVDHVWWST